VSVALLCIAKAPVAGRVKTRLSPPCTPEEAARLAEAALADTLEALRPAPAHRRILVLEGDLATPAPDGFEVVPQAPGGLGERLSAAFAVLEGPALVVNMDTPQMTPELMTEATAALGRPGVDAVLGPAHDEGYWAIGLLVARAEVFTGVPMSTPHTATAQRCRLRELGRHRRELPVLRDVDTMDDARAVAALAPQTRFAATLREIERRGVEANAPAAGPPLSLR
jgi:uncharacterized protein